MLHTLPFLVLLLLPQALGFGRSLFGQVRHTSRGSQFLLDALSSDASAPVFDEGSLKQEGNFIGHTSGDDDDDCRWRKSKKSQLWLDLRSTAFYPHEAVPFLQDQLGLESSIIDGFLVSEAMFAEIVNHEHRSLPERCVLLYETETGILGRNDVDTQQSIPVGKTIVACGSKNGNESFDPFQALETIQAGQWLFLDAPNSPQRSSMRDQVASILQLFNGGAAIDTITSSGLLLPGAAVTGALQRTNGGIAVACVNRKTFLEVDLLLEEYSLQSTSTASGLLLPGAPRNEQDNGSNTALVLPLDLHVWCAARDVRQVNDNSEESVSDEEVSLKQ
jgi:hypothetical protein